MRPDQARTLADIFGDENVGAGIAKLRRIRAKENQTIFGRRWGLSRQQMTFVEMGRRPITAAIGWEICRTFDCHPHWVLNGGGPETQPPRLDTIPAEKIALIEKKIKRYGSVLFRVFFGLLTLADENLSLTIMYEKRTDINMSEIEKLLKRVRGQVSSRGMKVKLAAALGVPHSRISEWLHGKCEPSGDVALRLLGWVQEREINQQKSSGSVVAPPEPKTRTNEIRL